MEARYPVRTKELVWQKAGNEYLLVDQESKKSIKLDPMTFLIWTQCDGSTEIGQIVDVFALNSNRDLVAAAVDGVLRKLETEELIKWKKN